ncbi:branched-chain amino acid ABC transporter permease [Roseospira marina]|uniref:Branched-chain amino acid ABC transporter permease n=1 Tax=Roseospira marina TaxID=140057 RepID=A0A5M6IEI9_9PROT|nr:AzlC family ABC transporter permease [Roseospira marina]KAA5606701.1 branched-chain amino acid ABC transporter permease [Roseospira marina]MBB4313886.1 putative branched-subunit amino acid permease [Roseospira marina]MBB5087048.1 putative branched-subunit amino acid permease [Roseospira marina]
MTASPSEPTAPTGGPADGYGSRGAALRAGLRLAVGAPAVVLAASYIGFGALVRSVDWSLPLGLMSSAVAFALPGQIVVVEMTHTGASLLLIAAAVALTNFRLMPMTLVLMGRIRDPEAPRWWPYAVAHLIAVTSWLVALQRIPDMPVRERTPFVFGFGLAIWSTTLTATGVGYALHEAVPPLVSLGLVFLTPLYFLLMMVADLRQRARLYAVIAGALVGPPLHLLTPDWGLVLSGLTAGTVAFSLDRRAAARDSARAASSGETLGDV